MARYQILNEPHGLTPVMFVHLEGWIDAGAGGSRAIATILDHLPTAPLVSFDTDQLLDYRSRRPTTSLADGVHAGMSWPEISIRGTEPLLGDASALILTGPEPDFVWHGFCDDVVSLAQRFGVQLIVSFGAFPAPVPHTRPVSVATTAVNTPAGREIAGKIGYVPGSIEVPAALQNAIEVRAGEAGITAVGLWARVPHYVANLDYPQASLSLIEAAIKLTEMPIPEGTLRSDAESTRGQIDELIEGNDEHVDMVKQLESSYDSGLSSLPRIIDETIPTADEIAAELERFLRDQQQG